MEVSASSVETHAVDEWPVANHGGADGVIHARDGSAVHLWISRGLNMLDSS